jgi:PAS domain S-box
VTLGQSEDDVQELWLDEVTRRFEVQVAATGAQNEVGQRGAGRRTGRRRTAREQGVAREYSSCLPSDASREEPERLGADVRNNDAHESVRLKRQTNERWSRTLADQVHCVVGIGQNGLTVYRNELGIEAFELHDAVAMFERNSEARGEERGNSKLVKWICIRPLRKQARTQYKGVALRADGTRFSIECSSYLIDSPDGPTILVVLTDASGRMKPQGATDRSEGSAESLLGESHNKVCIWRHGNTLIANLKFANSIGFGIRQVALRPSKRITAYASLIANTGMMPRCLTDPASYALVPELHADGIGRGDIVSASKTLDANGEASLQFMSELDELKYELNKLGESEARFRSLFEMPHKGFSIASPIKRGIFANGRMCEIFGYSAEEFARLSWIELTHTEDIESSCKRLSKLVAGEVDCYSIEKRCIRKNGDIFWAEVAVSCVRGEDGSIQLLSGCVQDITDQKRAEVLIGESEARFQTFFNLPLVGVAITSPDKGFIAANQRICDILGYSRQELLEKDWAEITHPDDLEVELGKFAGLLSGEIDSYSIDKRFIREDGKTVWTSISICGVRKRDGTIDYVIGNLQDITERKEADLKIRYLNRVYAMASGISAMILRERERQSIFEGACRIAVEKGLFRMAWIGVPDAGGSFLRPVASAGYVEGYLSCVRIDLSDPVQNAGPAGRCYFTGECTTCDDVESDPSFATWKDAANSRGYHSTGSAPLKIGGKVVGVINLYASERGFFSTDELRLLKQLADDISFALEMNEREAARQQAEINLRRSEERFRQVMENMQEVFWMTNVIKTEVEYVSPSYAKVWGQSCESLYQSPKSWISAIHPEDRERVEKAVALQGKGTYDETYRIVRPDGTSRWIHDRGMPVRESDGSVIRIVGTAQDITDRRVLEEQLRQAQKMEAIGQLAGGVAHDFNNILAAVMLQAQLSSKVENMPSKAKEGLHQIQAYAERGSNLTRQLLLFSRRQSIEPRYLNLNGNVTNLARMLQRIIGENIRLYLELPSQPMVIRADAGMIDQLLMNLVLNARDAMPNGGRLKIQTCTKNIPAARVAADPDLSPGRYVCLRVRDSGCGIRSDHVKHLFEPFFTTKEPGKGTGLGLAIVFGIVKQHGGTISVQTEVGKGTTFEVLLPCQEPSPIVNRPEARGKTMAGKELVLLVEDQADLHELMRTTLESAGYSIISATNGPEALHLWEIHKNAVRVLLSDLVLSDGMSGYELAKRLRTSAPELRVVLVSGHSPEITAKSIGEESGQYFLQKPCPASVLLGTLKQALGA